MLQTVVFISYACHTFLHLFRVSIVTSSTQFAWSAVKNRLLWRRNDRDDVSNHQLHDCLLNRLSRRKSKKTSKIRATGLCVGNSPVTGEFSALRASNAENVSIWWCHNAWTEMFKSYELKYMLSLCTVSPKHADALSLSYYHFLMYQCHLFIHIFLVIFPLTLMQM